VAQLFFERPHDEHNQTRLFGSEHHQMRLFGSEHHASTLKNQKWRLFGNPQMPSSSESDQILRVEIEQRTDSPPFVPNCHLTCRHAAFGETGSHARRSNLRTRSSARNEQLDAKRIHGGCSHCCSKNGVDKDSCQSLAVLFAFSLTHPAILRLPLWSRTSRLQNRVLSLMRRASNT
jgi:hypothetical protein